MIVAKQHLTYNSESPERYYSKTVRMPLEYLPVVILNFAILGYEIGKSVCLLVNALLLWAAL